MAGEQKVWRVVHVPSVDEEDRRQLHRAMQTAKQDRTRVINQEIPRSLLRGYLVKGRV
jgi:hypothetical protein